MKTNTITSKLDHVPQAIAGRKVIVTGGSSGIGRAITLLLASEGAEVLTCARDNQTLNEASRDFEDAEGTVHTVVADLSEREGVERVFSEADDKLGEIDAVVCNAALPAGTVIDADYQDIQTVVQTNLLGYLACCREAVQRMKARKSGHIVLIGSMSADVREKGSSIYVATKSGIQGFSESLRKEVNELGIKVTLIEPGAVGSDMQSDKEHHAAKADALKMLKAEDIAACVQYCLTQPKRCDIVAVSIRPHLQSI
jgi:NADP-dependent 3-hydroxy acid dehydrogenase YdfG